MRRFETFHRKELIDIKTIMNTLSEKFDNIEIHTFSDLHIGDVHCDMKRINERLAYVKDKENAFVILNGDIMNNATKTSVSDCYAEDIPPMEQLERFVSLFEPVKDKILAVTSGNHENRTYNKEGIDLTFVACNQLNILDKYSKTGALVFVKFGKGTKHENNRVSRQLYTIYCTHGSGGGRKEGAKAIRLADMATVVDADIYLMGHTHMPLIMKQGFYRVDRLNCTANKVDKLFVNTSAMLDYGGYGEAFQFKPSSKDCPVIYLGGTRRQMDARL